MLEKLIIGLGAISLVFIISIFLAIQIMLLWNWLMPEIFGLVKVNLLKAWGLSMLCGLLFQSSSSSKK